ncbi:MAG: hypothetical protein ABSA63_09020 [Thermoplasmata archaeon]|jgi:hypothetical protein
MAGHSADTAETLILIGLIFQVITVVLLLSVGLIFLVVPFLGGIVIFFAFLGFIWVILVYVFSYARTREGDYDGARTPTLVFGILSLLSVGILSGVLYIIAYVKLGDAIDEEEAARNALPTATVYGNPFAPPVRPQYTAAPPLQPPLASSPPSVSPTGSGSKFCWSCGQPTAFPARFCRNCGAPVQQG